MCNPSGGGEGRVLLGHAGVCDHHGPAEDHLQVHRLQDVEGGTLLFTSPLPVTI